MANHASAEKRNRQRVQRAARNRAIKSSLRTALKKARAAIASGDAGKAKAPVKEASRALASAVSKGALHRRAASRLTSRIESSLAALGR